MTSTEERLADALNASYAAARALPLRPLTLARPRARRWVLWFAPVAAALAVVAVVAGLNALTGRAAVRGRRSRRCHRQPPARVASPATTWI